MLENLKAILRGSGSPSAGAVLRRAPAVCALVGLLAATIAFAQPIAAAGLASAEGDPSLAAAATLPFFFSLTVQGDPAHLRISMRNTGEDAWEPAQDIRLRRLASDGTTPEGESYPLESTVEPGQAVSWDIVVMPDAVGLSDWRYAMCEGERSFGSAARAVVVVLPSLQGGPQSFGSGVESAVQTLADWGERTFGGALRSFASSVRGLFEGFLQGPLR